MLVYSCALVYSCVLVYFVQAVVVLGVRRCDAVRVWPPYLTSVLLCRIELCVRVRMRGSALSAALLLCFCVSGLSVSLCSLLIVVQP